MKKNNRKRKAAIAAAALLLFSTAGTFAWQAISQRALNENEAQHQPGGRVHDDYNAENGNKNIFAENYGELNLVVRIKLSEFLALDGQSVVEGAEKNERTTWTPYHAYSVETPGEEDEEASWTLEPTGETLAFRPYVTWELGGDDKIFLPTFNTNKDSLSVDTKGDAIDEILGELNNGVANGQYTKPANAGTGLFDEFTNGAAYDTDLNQVTPVPSEPTDTVHIAKPTMNQDRAPIGIDEWKALPAEEKVGNYWVIDGSDGWAYWANLLPPKQATSMLLKQLNFNEDELEKYEDWYYGIDVTGQFATVADWEKTFTDADNGGISQDALQLIKGFAVAGIPTPEED